ncbi:MAG: hypothetical protein EHM93_12645 [Bacteroidales bacterium]|nr:MAG: hypothetical protein EHM93_12645 [Bacteroidales bacterium]
MKKSILYNCLFITFFQGNIINQAIATPDSTKNKGNSTYIHQKKPEALFRAIAQRDSFLVKTLIEQGFDPNIKDDKGWTPLDYAKKSNRAEIETFLISAGAKTYIKPIPDMLEGPHIRISDSSTIDVSFLKHDSLQSKSSINRISYHFNDFPQEINGTLIESKDIDFNTTMSYPKGDYRGVKKIFVVGDVHGEYDRVYKILKGNRIIDNNGNWNWGAGHLAFIGDIFDRGSKVTEMLWLIFKLEKQAIKSGGKVHLLLGNHEPMIFKNDLRYVADNYYALCENLGLSYSKLFDEKSVLGHWIRQKPVILKINDFIFVHAGISPKLFEMKMGIDSINSLVWHFFNNQEDKSNTDTRSFILSSKGILWYRGYTPDESSNNNIDEKTLENELEFYKGKAFIVGHTEVDSISIFHTGRVINVNIPKANSSIQEQALLIEGNKVFVVYNNGDKKILTKITD